MRDLCLNEGVLQSYCDGELAPETRTQVVAHLASCALCAEAARQIESQMELTTAAFAHELSLFIPSERLRVRLDKAILDFNKQSLPADEPVLSNLRRWLSSFASIFNLSRQRVLGFASVLFLVILAAVLGGILVRQHAPEYGIGIVAGRHGEPGEWTFLGPDNVTQPLYKGPISKRRSMPVSMRPRARASSIANEVLLAHRVLPGERNYLRAISVLTDAIEANGESSLKPTLLADYMRNLAVVDHAITATQQTARTNPNSPDAAEMLYAVYQSKLDLLSAVAEQSRPAIAQR